MSKVLTHRPNSGQFILGRRTAEKISAVEGIVASPRTGKLLAASDAHNENGEARRARIRAEFKK